MKSVSSATMRAMLHRKYIRVFLDPIGLLNGTIKIKKGKR